MAHKPEGQQQPRRKGSVFQNGSSTLWIKFSERGIPRRENSHSSDRRVAEKLLQRRLAEVTTVTYIPRENIRVDELIGDLLEEHKVNGRKSTSDVEARWRLHLLPFFTRRRATDVTTDLVRRHISLRLQEGAENATINRELSLLKRAFNLARECTPPKVRIVPYIPMLKESNVRRGFLEWEQRDRLASECTQVGLWMRALFEVGFTYGWRYAELAALHVRQVNLLTGSIRLDPGTTKNDDGREVVMTKPVRELLMQCVHGKGPDDYVFTRDDGRPVRDFRGTWSKVCCAAGLGELVCPECEQAITAEGHCNACSRKWKRSDLKYVGLIFHDLRRTAVRNMVRAGVPERVAMTVSGHKTRSVFDRYHIVSRSDIAEAARKVEASQECDATAQKNSDASTLGQNSGRVAPKTGTARSAASPASLPN
jgi:integrase